MNSENPFKQVETEMVNARLARNQGFEGKARVCARRAVGQAIYVSGFSAGSSLSAIQEFIETGGLPDEIIVLARSFLEKVNDSYQLQPGVDLLENADRLIAYLQLNKNLT
jgi:hypothetical protein